MGMPSEKQQTATYASSNASKTSYDANLSKSRDWAVMSRFESEVFAREQAEIAAEKHQKTIDQRHYLDIQMKEQHLRELKAVEVGLYKLSCTPDLAGVYA
jgi:hypothetical protein